MRQIKVCPKCLIEKPITEFFKSKARIKLDGVRYECKVCSVEARRIWASKNVERVRDLNTRWVSKDRERSRQKQKAYRLANPDKTKAHNAAYWAANREALKEYSRRYREENKEKVAAQKRAYAQANRKELSIKRKAHYAANREEARGYSRKFKRENRAYYNAVGALRKSLKRRAAPPWLSDAQKSEMALIYEDCRAISEASGIDHHVDHIVPIRGETVCGLHVPWNLRVITASENISKGNRLLPEWCDCAVTAMPSSRK